MAGATLFLRMPKRYSTWTSVEMSIRVASSGKPQTTLNTLKQTVQLTWPSCSQETLLRRFPSRLPTP